MGFNELAKNLSANETTVQLGHTWKDAHWIHLPLPPTNWKQEANL